MTSRPMTERWMTGRVVRSRKVARGEAVADVVAAVVQAERRVDHQVAALKMGHRPPHPRRPGELPDRLASKRLVYSRPFPIH